VTLGSRSSGHWGTDVLSRRIVKILFSFALLAGAAGYGWYLLSLELSAHGLVLGYFPTTWLALAFFLLMYGPALLFAIVTLLEEAVFLLQTINKGCLRIARWLEHLRRLDRE
jgi:hypothetical protein